MTKTLTAICIGIVYLLLANPSLVFALAEASSSGTITVDWSQDNAAYSWTAENGAIYGMNGADAVSYTESNGTRIEIDSDSDYSSPYWVSPLDAVADTSEATLSGTVTGFAETTSSSVFSSGTISNDGAGVILNASGTSHLVRGFTVSSTGNFAFDVVYSFTNSASTGAVGEWTDWYHFAELILKYDDQQIIDVIKFGANDLADMTGTLSVNDTWVVGREYSIELHTYNSATAFSPASAPASVPEPATILLLGCGLLGLGWYKQRNQ